MTLINWTIFHNNRHTWTCFCPQQCLALSIFREMCACKTALNPVCSRLAFGIFWIRSPTFFTDPLISHVYRWLAPEYPGEVSSLIVFLGRPSFLIWCWCSFCSDGVWRFAQEYFLLLRPLSCTQVGLESESWSRASSLKVLGMTNC